MGKEIRQPPPRKEPGLFSRALSGIFGFMAWLVFALFLSVIMEWVGIALFWPEQGEYHAQKMLQAEMQYLDQRIAARTESFGLTIVSTAQTINNWITKDSGFTRLIQRLSTKSEGGSSKVHWVLKEFYGHYRAYILAAFYVTQLFFVRLAIVTLSLSAFLLFAVVGVVDGLVERYLRRKGGGRESSNVYNLARKSVLPLFVSACVLYISMPFSIHPSLVIIPFAVLVGFSLKVTMDKLKKYF